jgi:mRNA interferase MazF
VRRGEVWWARFDDQHPVVLLSDEAGGMSGLRAVQLVAPSGVPLGDLGLEVALGPGDGLPFDAVVRIAFPRPGFLPCTWATTVGAGDLVDRLVTLSPEKLAEIDDALAAGERIVPTDETQAATAGSALAAIRQSLREGTLTTRQITRPQ